MNQKYLCLLYLSGFRPSDMELLLKRTSGYSALTKKRIARKLSKEL